MNNPAKTRGVAQKDGIRAEEFAVHPAEKTGINPGDSLGIVFTLRFPVGLTGSGRDYKIPCLYRSVFLQITCQNFCSSDFPAVHIV